MSMIANVVVALIGLLHVYILVLEMFLWDKPAGLRAFRQKQEFATATKVLAANQGLYNGFLAAGLLWGLVYPGAAGIHVQMFFLGCVIVAGIYGGLTVSKRILYLQGGLALLALLVLLAG
jgi:putative membrane protein